MEVPLDDRELPFLVAGRSADFQDVNVNGVVTFRVREPELLAERVDFSIDTRTGRWRNEPLDKLAVVVKELAQELAGSFVARAPLRALLDQGIEVMRDEIQRGLVGRAERVVAGPGDRGHARGVGEADRARWRRRWRCRRASASSRRPTRRPSRGARSPSRRSAPSPRTS